MGLRIIGVKIGCPWCWKLKGDFNREINRKLSPDKQFVFTYPMFLSPIDVTLFEYKRGEWRTPTILIDRILVRGYSRQLIDLIKKILKYKGDLI